MKEGTGAAVSAEAERCFATLVYYCFPDTCELS
jgi:hypothetical protein